LPRIVRPMFVDADRLPRVGTKGRCLGVRESGKYADVDVDAVGWVLMNRKGLSVTADWRTLKGHLLPEHLDDGLNDASGVGMAVFVHGNGIGAFAEGPVAQGLELYFKPDRTDRGVVGPTATVLGIGRT
jgi:hypothetical protein